MNRNNKRIAMQTCIINNYGACLQAYALQQSIKKKYPNCNILNFDRYGHKAGPIDLLKGLVIYYRDQMKPLSDWNRKHKNNKRFKEFKETYLSIDYKYTGRSFDKFTKANEEYDAFVCGSDIIWNPNLRYANIKFDMLSFADENKTKVAYAPSFGISDFPKEKIPECKQYLQRFNALSCREEQGVNILKNSFDLRGKAVLDPTLLLDKEEWVSGLNICHKEKEKPYYLFYVFDDFDLNGIINHLLEISDLNIYLLLNTRLNKDIKNNERVKLIHESIGPIEFVKYISGAKCVFTNSFHASAFSINFNVPFILFDRDNLDPTKSINSRLDNIVNMFELHDRKMKVKDIELIDINTINNCDYSKANNRLNEMRKDCLNYLFNSIGD